MLPLFISLVFSGEGIIHTKKKYVPYSKKTCNPYLTFKNRASYI